MQKLSVVKNFNYNLIGMVISNLSFTLGISIISRKFGPEKFGEVNSFVAFIAIFIPMITQGASNYYMREYSKRENNDEISAFLQYTVPVFCILATLFSLFFLVFHIYKIPTIYQIAYIFLILLSQAIDIQWLYRAKEATKVIAYSMCVGAVANILFIIAMLFFHSLTVGTYLIAISLSKLISSILLYKINKENKKSIRLIFFAIKPQYFLRIFSKRNLPIILLSISGLLNLLYLKSDIVILTFFGFKLEAGYYSSAYTIINMIFLLRSTMLSTVMPSLIRSLNKSYEAYIKMLNLYLKIGAIAGIVITGTVYFFSKPIIFILFGEQYFSAIPVLNILLVMNLVVFLNLGLSASLIIFKKDKEFMIATCIAALINIIGNLIFVPFYGMYAAAWTTLIAETFIVIYALLILNSIHSDNYFKLFWESTKKIISIGIIIFLTIVYLNERIKTINDNYFMYILNVLAFLISFIILCYISKVVTKKEYTLLIR